MADLKLEERIAKRKEAQAKAHRKWRESAKGEAYRLKQKLAKYAKQEKVNEPPAGS